MANQQIEGTDYKTFKKIKTEHQVVKDVKNGGILNGANNENDEEHFLEKVFKILMSDGVFKSANPKCKVVDFVHPADLYDCMDFSLKDDGEDNETLLKACQDTIEYSVRTGHPGFHNQLFGGFDQYGLAGAWLTETMNTSQYTYEVAPVFTLMEQVVLKRMYNAAGFEEGDGIFCPGGSVSNMYGLSLARYHKFPEVKSEGMCALPRICMFTSEHSHYSLKKGASFMGFGVNSLIKVKCDEQGKMIPAELLKAIENAKSEGRTPFFVNATAATTVLGAFDPFHEIADICEAHGLWMHVDACWGGGVLLSNKHKHKMAGVERADSVAWNAHKMMGAPLQCCAFLTKHKGLMQEAHSANARYLFQQDKFYDVSYDTGDKSIQCGRKVDVFKLWLMWKAKGNKGFEKEVDNAFENAKYLTKKKKVPTATLC